MIDWLYHTDLELFLKIHRGLSNDFFDWLLPLLRNRFFWAPLYVFFIVYCIKRFKKNGYYIIGGTLLTFAIGDLTASRLLKNIFVRIRPCNEPLLSDEIIARVLCGSGYSFPSAHATNHFAIAVFVILVFYKYWKPVLPIGIIWAASIAFSQVYVGVHYPVDITVGAILGTVIGFGVHKLFKKIKPDL